jgi:nitrite reductase/ring-hydroxylating ferredoxin subunit
MSKIIPVLVLLAMILSTVACSGNSAQSNEPIKATWIEPQVVGDTVSIPVSKVENNKIVDFKLVTLGSNIAFMAYELGGEVYVRSNVCPPCRSVGFSLQGDTLVCDTCLTTFNAKTGDGIEGACVDFPKASVPYEISDGNIVMKSNDLVAAYQSTLNPGWP